MRIAAGVEYRGSAYQGFERQRNGPTVQATLEAALTRVAASPIRVVCAGRTDSGVHAWGQVVHFDPPVARPDRAWLLGTNTHLPDDISVAWVQPVTDDFHARFAAVRRRYRYVVYQRNSVPAVLHGLVTWERRPLDVMRMQAGAAQLVGEHDFSAYRAKGCQARSPVRTVSVCAVSASGAFVYIDVQANAFLQHMVRNIAGVLLAIGAGARPVDWVGEVLAGRERERGGVTAPPHGLYLMEVGYPAPFQLPRVPGPGCLW